jgi:hypothetical protein
MGGCQTSGLDTSRSAEAGGLYEEVGMRKFSSRDNNALAAAGPNSLLALAALLLFEALVLGELVLAYQDHFLTVEQMLGQGIGKGLPFVWHFAMWGDILIISPLSAFIIGRYSREWTAPTLVASATLGAAIAGLMHWIYTFSAMPETHIRNHQLTLAGILHLLYMALVLTVYIEFFLFTGRIKPALLRIISIVLFVHVIIGTHLALGTLALVLPLEWYSARPLESVIGWLTIAIVAVSLLWRNYGREVFKKMFIWYLYWTGNDISTTEGLFKFLSEISRVVAIWTYIGVMGQIIYRYWNGKIFDLGGFFSEGFLQCVLVGVVGLTYWLGQLSVKQEIGIAKAIFPPGRIPRDWGTPRDRRMIVALVISFCILYLVIAYISQYILLVSGLMTILAANDYHTRYKINQGIDSYFNDDRYSPKSDEEDFGVIKARRVEVRRFLFKRPHLLKEILRTVGCGVSFIVAGCAYIYEKEWLEIAAYLLLIFTLFLNELVTVRWRLIRDSRLRAIDEREGRSRMLA